MATLAQFTTNVLSQLWRTDDTALEAYMSEIIRRTTSKILRDVQMQSFSTITTLTFTSQASEPLPIPRQQIKALIAFYQTTQAYRFWYVEPETFFARGDPQSFTVANNRVYAPVADDAELTLIYFGGIEPVFDTVEGADDGFETRHPDFVLYAACFYASEWLRDGDSSAYYAAKYAELKEEVIAYERGLLYPDVGIDLPVPGVVV